MKNLPASKDDIRACLGKGRCFLGKNKIDTHVGVEVWGLWIEVRESRVAEDRFGARCGETHVLEQPGAGAVACGGGV